MLTNAPWKNPKTRQKTIVPALVLRRPIQAKMRNPEIEQHG
jgi:hypothetical protein